MSKNLAHKYNLAYTALKITAGNKTHIESA